MKPCLKIRQLKLDIENKLHAAGYYCLYGMSSHGRSSSYVNAAFDAIDVMTHEIQLMVTVNIRGQVSDAIMPAPLIF